MHYILCSRSLLSLGMTSGLAGEGVGGSVGELEMAAWLQQVFLPFLLSLSLSVFLSLPFFPLFIVFVFVRVSVFVPLLLSLSLCVFLYLSFFASLSLSLSLSLIERISHAHDHNQVWFKHVPTPNFLLADSFPVHTAQTTQKLLLQVPQKRFHCSGFIYI